MKIVGKLEVRISFINTVEWGKRTILLVAILGPKRRDLTLKVLRLYLEKKKRQMCNDHLPYSTTFLICRRLFFISPISRTSYLRHPDSLDTPRTFLLFIPIFPNHLIAYVLGI